MQNLNPAASLGAITLFVEEFDAVKTFYTEVFGKQAIYEDADSVVFKFGETMFNFLKVSQANELVEPAIVGAANAGARFVFTTDVENVDATCDALIAKGVKLLNGPMDRPWGIRTASSRSHWLHLGNRGKDLKPLLSFARGEVRAWRA